MSRSQITTHILNTAQGTPAKNVAVQLLKCVSNQPTQWQLITQANTDDDGRISDWINPDEKLAIGTYKLIFELENYWQQQNQTVFYPTAEICFNLTDEQHYHIPLLLSPFAYSTYRGS